MKLIKGKNYRWLMYLTWIFMFVPSIVIYATFAQQEAVHANVAYTICFFPIYAACILALEIRSGVALDGAWNACLEKGTREYAIALLIHGFFPIIWLLLCVFLFYPAK